MKPDHYQRNHALAAEYVLGTLRGAARRRFETWMLESPRVRRQVWYWERRFHSLNGAIVERRPPVVVWRRIQARIGRPRAAPRAWWWPVGSVLAASLVLAVVLLWSSAPSYQAFVGVVQNSQAEPLWVLRTVTDDGHRQLSLRGVNVEAVPGKDFELWLLPRSGAAISVGLLPTRNGQRTAVLNERQLEVLRRSRSLAVSLEPAGGSPSGQPTGPVLYQVRMISL
mgnify:FL=1